MLYVKNILLKLVSFGIFPQMDENKKIAIHISSFDAVTSCLAFLFYFIYDIHRKNSFISYSHGVSFVLCIFGIYLINSKRYDAGRILIHFVGLSVIFITIDGFVPSSGLEFYYFAPIIVPFATFTPAELKKSFLLALSGLIIFFIQQIVGPGHFSVITQISDSDRVLTIAILFMYIIGLFSISRWQMNKAYDKIKAQQAELIHISNITALAEMSGGISHEINNPLQILSAQISFVKRSIKEIENIPERVLQSLDQMDETILRISSLVRGLRNLSRNVDHDPLEIFTISRAMEDMLAVTSQRLKHLNIDLKIEGDTNIQIQGHVVQLSQVFINLIHNAIDAINEFESKWIEILITTKENNNTVISFTDSGNGIPKDIAQKIMLPFFTSKDPGKGTGLGLSISSSMLEKVGGRLYYEPNSTNTKFMIELPKV